MAGGWFHTGDGGYLDGPTTVITDRKKDVIITGGENVSSIEVEDCLFQHGSVAEAAVIGVPDERTGEAVKLVVVKNDPELTEAQLREHCRHNLTNYKNPRWIEFRRDLPKTPIGKVLRRELRNKP